MLNLKKLRELQALCVCEKQRFENDEKSRLSGFLNTWHIYSHEVVLYVDDERTLVPTDAYVFAYKQNPVVSVKEFVNDHPQYLNEYLSMPNSRKIRNLAFKEGYWHMPHFAYGCSFMVGIITHPWNNINEYRFRWTSGDDDLGNEFLFPKADLKKVQDFIKNHFKSETFGLELSIFIEESGYTFC